MTKKHRPTISVPAEEPKHVELPCPEVADQESLAQRLENYMEFCLDGTLKQFAIVADFGGGVETEMMALPGVSPNPLIAGMTLLLADLTTALVSAKELELSLPSHREH